MLEFSRRGLSLTEAPPFRVPESPIFAACDSMVSSRSAIQWMRHRFQPTEGLCGFSGPGAVQCCMPRPSATAVTSARIAATEPESFLAQAAAGDRAAFIQIYDHFAPQVLGVIRRVLADAAAGELALEDVFVKLWKEAPQLVRARASVAAWLMLTARAYAVDRLRRGGDAPPSSAPMHHAVSRPDESLSWMPDAQAIARLDERRVLLRKVLGQLPRPQLKSLELMMFAGRDEAELAVDLGEPLARVKTELRAATRFLRHRRRAVTGSWTVDI